MPAFVRRLLNDPFALIFTLISLAYVVRGVRLLRVGWERRQDLGQDPLTAWKKGWADQAAFYVAVPPGVFVHELFHALAVWAFGGQVVEFGFGFYWGYVLPSGSFTASEQWVISAAGTAGTLLYGAVLWLLLRSRATNFLRFLGLRILRFHLIYGLVYYPLFTLFTFIGDWRTIYNFSATPLLSGSMLIVHGSLLAFLWWSSRQGWYDMPTFASAQERTRVEALQSQARQNPMDSALQLQAITALARSGELRTAESQLNRFLAQEPRSAEAHLLAAVLASTRRRAIAPQARRHLDEALALGLASDVDKAQAYALLAQYHLHVEKWEQAVAALDQALRYAPAGGDRARANLYYLRAQARRRQRRYEPAEQDIARAIGIAEAAGLAEELAAYQREHETIMRHKG